jgi:hypothetical protein
MKPDDILSVLTQPIGKLVDLVAKLENYASRYFATADPSAKLCEIVEFPSVGAGAKCSVSVNLAKREIRCFSPTGSLSNAPVEFECRLNGNVVLSIKSKFDNFLVAFDGSTDIQTYVIPIVCYCDEIVQTGNWPGTEVATVVSTIYRA